MAELSPQLVEMLVCPEDKQPLAYIESESVLYNPRTAKVYEVRDGIPVMLIDEARVASSDETARFQELIRNNASRTTGPEEGK